MKPTALRLVMFALALTTALSALFAMYSWPGSGVPWRAEMVRELPLAAFGSNAGQVALTEFGVRVEGKDAGGITALLQRTPGLLASDYRYFCFDLDRVPTTSQPVLVWQQAGATRMVPLPDAPFANGCFDLLQQKEWSGGVDVVGLALAPTDYLAPSLVDEPFFELLSARLESPSWRSALRSLWSRWSAYRPWNGRSNHTGGFELAGAVGPSLQGFIAACGVVTLGLIALCFGRRAATRAGLPLLVAAAALLAIYQGRQLALRAAVATSASAAAARQPEQALAALPGLVPAADAMSTKLAAESEPLRVLVHGTGLFMQEYPTWLLRRQNVATLRSPKALPSPQKLVGTVLVLAGEGDWEFRASEGKLRLADQERSAQPYLDAGVLKAYRFADPGAVP